jgi:CxxC motif-containing protein (DUF1111 family)
MPDSSVPRSRAAVGALLLGALLACDGLITNASEPGDLFDSPVDGLSPAEAAAFVRGDAEFGRGFSPRTGLGPIFNNVSCASCHSGDGRGVLANSLQRIGSESDEFLRPLGGPQIQDKAVPGMEPERLPAGVPVSLRLPPPVFGVGLIEAIPEEAILARQDLLDLNRDGISGRANVVTPAPYVPGGAGRPRVGRFGRKAQISNLLEQVVEAYHQDIGITSEFRPHENPNPRSSVPVAAVDLAADPEIPTATIDAVVHYIRALAPPAPGPQSSESARGQTLFGTVGCATCHVPEYRTGTSVLGALSNQPVPLYSDLLLHDMGDGLADNRPDGLANGREWRTAPLWGLRLMRQFLNGDAFLLHDGRARSVEQAILLHGGEGQRSRDLFGGLPADDKRALLSFVESR